ncbi:DUF6328 family protein [Arthrobacter sp. UM1]|uniref:DUF6328 family protein n=1 Tax=Arthrobacter sp. UM1 TaxID=2766776 RepID=UPI001CF6CAA0|nr:DUF6328 family protein [Arthrobacter sp. UM1]MCB4208196.1 sodium:proton antiporter [Arthrobacter sp. UM1]
MPGTHLPHEQEHEQEQARQGRHETPDEQRDRQWTDLLQELRVMQTGTQILAGFLLTLPFQQRFGELDATARAIYLATLLVTVSTAILMLVPVAMHRRLFGRHVKDRLVASGHLVLRAVLVLVGLLLLGVASLVAYVVVGPAAAVVVALLFGASLVGALVVYPSRVLRRGGGGRG